MKKLTEPQRQIAKAIGDLIKKHGGVKAKIARKLSENAEKPISPQLLGQYERGDKTPGAYFILRWEEVYGEKLTELVKPSETKVSHGTKEGVKLTHGGEAAITEKNLHYTEEREILIRSLDTIGRTNEYLLKRIKELGG